MIDEMKELLEARRTIRAVLHRIGPFRDEEEEATSEHRYNIDVAHSVLNERIGMLVGGDGKPLEFAGK